MKSFTLSSLLVCALNTCVYCFFVIILISLFSYGILFMNKDKKKKYEPPVPTRVGKKKKKTKGPDAASKLPLGKHSASPAELQTVCFSGSAELFSRSGSVEVTDTKSGVILFLINVEKPSIE